MQRSQPLQDPGFNTISYVPRTYLKKLALRWRYVGVTLALHDVTWCYVGVMWRHLALRAIEIENFFLDVASNLSKEESADDNSVSTPKHLELEPTNLHFNPSSIYPRIKSNIYSHPNSNPQLFSQPIHQL